MNKKRLKLVLFPFIAALLVLSFTSCPRPIDEELVLVVEDDIAPVITITSPSDNSMYKGAVTVTGTITDSSFEEGDNMGILANLDFSVLDASVLGRTVTFNDDGTFSVEPDDATITYNPEDGSFGLSFSSVELSGVRILTFLLEDKNGNSTEKTITLFEDDNGPYIQVDSPQDQTNWGSNLTLSGKVTNGENDPGTDLIAMFECTLTFIAGTVDFMVPDVPTNDYDYSWDISTGDFLLTYDIPAFQSGTLGITIVTEDTSGHEAEEKLTLFDSVLGPPISFTSPAVLNFPEDTIDDDYYSHDNPKVVSFTGTIDPTNGIDSAVYTVEKGAYSSGQIPITPDGDGNFIFIVDLDINTNLEDIDITMFAYDDRLRASKPLFTYIDDPNDPNVTISPAAGQSLEVNTQPINFTVTFNEPVVGFDVGDIVLSGTKTGGSLILTGTGPVYNAEVSGITGDGTVIISIPPSVCVDRAGNPNTASTGSNLVIYDTTQPAASLSDDHADTIVRDADTLLITATFMDTNDIETSPAPTITIGGLVSGVTMTPTGDNKVWTYTWNVPSGNDGDVGVSISASDEAGNVNSTATGTTLYTIDNTPPSAPTGVNMTAVGGTAPPANTLNSTNTNMTAGATIAAGQATGGSAELLIGGVPFGTPVLDSSIGAGDTSVIFDLGTASPGALQAAVPSGGVLSVRLYDAAGNSEVSTVGNPSLTVDYLRPDVTIDQKAGQDDPTNTLPILFDVVFTKNVTGFDISDVSWNGNPVDITGAHINTISAGTIYEIEVTAVDVLVPDRNLIPTIAENLTVDSVGNGNTASTGTDGSVLLDRTTPSAPTGVNMTAVGGTAPPANTLNGTNTNMTAIASITAGQATGGSAELLIGGVPFGTPVLDGTIGAGDTTVTFDLGTASPAALQAAVPSGGVLSVRLYDAAGNSAVSTVSNPTLTVDYVAPSSPTGVNMTAVGGTAPPANTLNSTNTNMTAGASITAGQATDGSAELLIGGVPFGTPVLDGTIGAGDTTVTFDLGTASPAALQAAVPSGGVLSVRLYDAAGNSAVSTVSNPALTVDYGKPGVTVNQKAGQDDPTNSTPVEFTVIFTESVTGFTWDDVTWNGSATGLGVTVTGSGTDYEINVNSVTGDGTLEPTIDADKAQDAAGNGNASSTSTDNIVTYDTDSPDVTVNQKGGQSDPTNSTPVEFTVIFTESVTGFTWDDVTWNGSATGLGVTVTGSGTDYEINVNSVTGDGTLEPTIDADKAQDAAGNGNAASTSTDNVVTYDTDSPDVTVNQKGGQSDPTNTTPVEFTVIFSETVTGFAWNDVTWNGTATVDAGNITGSGTDYEINVTSVTGDGTLIPTIASGRAFDLAGNGNTASTSTDNEVTFDSDPPAVFGDVSGSGTMGATYTVTVDYDEAMDESGSYDPVIVYSPDPTSDGTWTLSSAGWADSDTYEEIYNYAAGGSSTENIDVDVTGARDIAGNTQTPYSGNNVITVEAQTNLSITAISSGGTASSLTEPSGTGGVEEKGWTSTLLSLEQNNTLSVPDPAADTVETVTYSAGKKRTLRATTGDEKTEGMEVKQSEIVAPARTEEVDSVEHGDAEAPENLPPEAISEVPADRNSGKNEEQGNGNTAVNHSEPVEEEMVVESGSSIALQLLIFIASITIILYFLVKVFMKMSQRNQSG